MWAPSEQETEKRHLAAQFSYRLLSGHTFRPCTLLLLLVILAVNFENTNVVPYEYRSPLRQRSDATHFDFLEIHHRVNFHTVGVWRPVVIRLLTVHGLVCDGRALCAPKVSPCAVYRCAAVDSQRFSPSLILTLQHRCERRCLPKGGPISIKSTGYLQKQYARPHKVACTHNEAIQTTTRGRGRRGCGGCVGRIPVVVNE